MIPNIEKEAVTSNHQPEAVYKFSIASSDMAIQMLIDLLSKLYPNPKQTLMVEYVQNAIDSHREAGKGDVPIEITLPTILEPYFIVRDYGIGMTDEFIKSMYTVAAESTKQGNNEDIGGMGIGKLVFSQYSGVMTLTAWDGVEKRIYTCRLKKGDGDIRRDLTIDSDEEQGIEIKIPVAEEDIIYFNDRVEYLYSYLPTKPIITNKEFNLEPEFYISNDKFTLLKNYMGGERFTAGHSLATIGGMTFPISTTGLGVCGYGKKSDDDTVRKVLDNLPLVLHFNVGEVEHTPCRSSLLYNDATIAAVKERVLEVIGDYVKDEYQNALKEITSSWDARNLSARINQEKSNESKLFRYFGLNNKGVEFNGKKYKHYEDNVHMVEIEDHYKLDNNGNWIPVTMSESRQHIKRVRSHYVEAYGRQYKTRLVTNSNTIINLHDGAKYFYASADYTDRKISLKVKKHIEDTGVHSISTIILKDGQTIEEVAKALEAPVDMFVNVDTLPSPQSMRSVSNGGTRKQRTSHDSKVLNFTGNGDKTEINVDDWEEVDVDLETSNDVYVVIRYYKPWDGEDYYNTTNLRNIVNMLSDQVDSDFRLIGVRTTEESKIGDDMISLEDFMNQKIESLREEIGNDIKKLQSTGWVEHHSVYDITNLIQHHDDIECVAIKHLIEKYKASKELRSEVKSRIGNYINVHNAVARYTTHNTINTVGSGCNHKSQSIYSMFKDIQNRYPLVKNWHNYLDKGEVEYINAMNFYRNSTKKRLTA